MFNCCISRQSADDEIVIRRRHNEHQHQIKLTDFASNVSFPCHGAKRAAGPAKNPAPFVRPDAALAPSFFQEDEEDTSSASMAQYKFSNGRPPEAHKSDEIKSYNNL